MQVADHFLVSRPESPPTNQMVALHCIQCSFPIFIFVKRHFSVRDARIQAAKISFTGGAISDSVWHYQKDQKR